MTTREPLLRRIRSLDLWLGPEAASDVRRRRRERTRLPLFRDATSDLRFVMVVIIGPFVMAALGIKVMAEGYVGLGVVVLTVALPLCALAVRYVRLTPDRPHRDR